MVRGKDKNLNLASFTHVGDSALRVRSPPLPPLRLTSLRQIASSEAEGALAHPRTPVGSPAVQFCFAI